MNSMTTIGLVITALDRASQVIKGMSDNAVTQLNRMQDKMKAVSDSMKHIGMASMGAGLVTMGAIQKPIRIFADLDEAQRMLKTTMMDTKGVVSNEFNDMMKLADRLGQELPGSTKDMVQMFIALREQGVQTKYILGGVGEAAAKFAVLMKLPFAEAATHAAKFQESMGVADKDAVAFMDTLQRLKFASGIQAGDLAYTFKYMGPSLKALNIQGLEDAKKLSAVIGVMAANSIEGSTAGTNFAQALSRMAEVSHRMDSKKIHDLVAPILEPKGIKLEFFTAAGQFKGIEGMVKELEKLQALNPQEKLMTLKKLFGDEAARPLAVLVDKGIAGYKEMADRMKQQADMEKKIQEIMAGTKMQWDTLTGTVSNFMAHLGGSIVSALRLNAVFAKLNSLFDKMDEWIMKHQRLAGVIGAIIAIGGGALTLFGAVAFGLGMIFSMASKAIGGIQLFTGVIRAAIPWVRLHSAELLRNIGYHRLMNYISYHGGFWKAMQYQLLVTKLKMLEINGAMKLWVAAQGRELLRLIGYYRLMNYISYHGGFWKSMQHWIFTTKLRLLDMSRTMKIWTVSQGKGILRLAGYYKLMDAISYHGGFWKTMQFWLLTTKHKMIETASAMKVWTMAQLSAFRVNFLTIAGLKHMAIAFGSTLWRSIVTASRSIWAFNLALLSSPIGWIAITIGAAAFLIYKYWAPISGFFRGLFRGIAESVKPLRPAWEVFKKIVPILSPIFGPLVLIYKLIRWLIKPVNDTGKAAESMGVRFGRAIGGILTSILSLPAKMLAAGANITSSLWQGMMSRINKPIEVMKALAQKIRAFLPFSPAKEGPLRDLHRVQIIETIASAVRPGALISSVQTAMDKARATLKPVAFNPLQTVSQKLQTIRTVVQPLTQPVRQILEPVRSMTAPMVQPVFQQAHGQGSQKLSGKAPSSTVINYNPSITISGEAAKAKEDFAAELKRHKDDILRMIESARAREVRVAY